MKKYLIDPLCGADLTSFVLGLLQPVGQPKEEKALFLGKECPAVGNGLISLPTEILDRIVTFLPLSSIFALRCVSSYFPTRISLNQHFFREHVLNGQLVPYLWDLDIQAFRDMQRSIPVGADPNEYWDWRRLGRYLKDVAGIVEHDPDRSDIPRAFWNRCRLWLTVIETEFW